MSFRVSRSEILNIIPPRKLAFNLYQTLKNCKTCSTQKIRLDQACGSCITINAAKQKYATSNIPIKYWDLFMNKHFEGDESLFNKYNEIAGDLESAYAGVSLCFAGAHGTGKTFTITNILKCAAEHGYSCLYVTLSDIVQMIISPTSQDKSVARQELLMVDFLAIDEFDPRHMGSSAGTDLYGRTLENLFRTRVQNTLPTFMCTNSPNVLESFSGEIKQSIDSLMNFVEIIPVLGSDFRKTHGVS